MKLEGKKWKMLKKRGRSLLATQLWNFVREKGGKESLPPQSREFKLFTWRTVNHPGDKPRLALYRIISVSSVRGIPSTQLAAACRGFLLPHEAFILSLLAGGTPHPSWTTGPECLTISGSSGFFHTTAMASSLWPLTIGLWSEVAQSCLTLCDPMDCSLPGSSVHGII